jgi:hypothetical protein
MTMVAAMPSAGRDGTPAGVIAGREGDDPARRFVASCSSGSSRRAA